MVNPPLMKIYHTLLAAFGPRYWWPAQTSEEVMLGAILAQNTTWKNANRAIGELKNAGTLSFEAIKKMNEKKLGELVRSARFFNQKAKALQVLADYFGNKHEKITPGEVAGRTSQPLSHRT